MGAKGTRFTRRGGAAITVATALSLGAANVAVAQNAGDKPPKPKPLGKVVTRTATSPAGTATGQFLTATATCPEGRVAFGGGFSTQPVIDNTIVFVNRSSRAGKRRWTSTGSYVLLAPGTPEPSTVTSYVYCRRPPRLPIKDIVATVPVPAMNNAVASTATATCPGKQRLLSGGFEYQPASSSIELGLVYESIGTGAGWRSSIQNSGSGVARTLTSHAYCTKKLLKSPKTTTQSTAAVVATLGAVTSTTPACPKGRRLTGGGFQSAFPPAGTPRPLYVASHISGGGWLATAQAGFVGGSLSVNSQGICT